MTAGQFMPHLSRFELAAELDLIVAELAIEKLHSVSDCNIGINLSTQLLKQPEMMIRLADSLHKAAEVTERLWIELPEFGVYQQLEGFQSLCQLLKPLKCKLGIEHVGSEVARIGELHDIGLDFVKIDRALIHDIHNNTSNQVFLRGLCTIVHSIGLTAIAEGVDCEQEWLALADLGLDGGTGRYFSSDT